MYITGLEHERKNTNCFVQSFSRWWFQRFFILTPTWGNDPNWRAYFSNGKNMKNHQLVLKGAWSRGKFPRSRNANGGTSRGAAVGKQVIVFHLGGFWYKHIHCLWLSVFIYIIIYIHVSSCVTLYMYVYIYNYKHLPWTVWPGLCNVCIYI